MDEGGMVASQSHVTVFVRKKDTKRGACPPKVNTLLEGTEDDWAELYWRHGERAGTVYTSTFDSATRCTGDDRMIADGKVRCGAWSPVTGLAVDACADVSGSNLVSGKRCEQ